MAGRREVPTGTVLTAWTGTLLRALEARDIDATALAAAQGISPDMLEDPERRIPLHLSTRLWRAAVAATGDDAFGIEASRHTRPSSFHALGHAFLSSPTLRAALERAARFSRVTADVATGSTRLEGHDFVFAIGWRATAERPSFEAVDAVFASIVRTARFLLDRDVSPSRVELERPTPDHLERFERFYRCPIRFDAPETFLAFDREIVERRVPGGDDRLASASETVLQTYLAGLASENVADQVRGILIDALSVGEPEVAAVAAELAMSPRSLQRHLADEGTTFRAVLAGTRRELADALLDSGESVTETAHRLGFSETAAFSRAYRRWTGSSPARNRSGAKRPAVVE